MRLLNHWQTRSRWTRISYCVLSLLAMVLIIYHELIGYGLQMGRHQLTIVWNARPVSEVMTDSLTPDSVRAKLRLIQNIRRYAIDSLGLIDSPNYTTYYDHGSEPILYALSASEAFQFKAKHWSFPIIGSFPYKGFFDLEAARQEARDLKADGWDVRIRSVGGWSTLGWFTDPILSGMLTRSEGDLANLIIHELVHSTVFIEDSIQFNENLASFIGDVGALRYLTLKYGQDSQPVRAYRNRDFDRARFREYILNRTDDLSALYDSQPFQVLPDSIKQSRKDTLIADIMRGVERLPFANPASYKGWSTARPNNAWFMTMRRYRASQSRFKQRFEEAFQGNIRRFLDQIKRERG